MPRVEGFTSLDLIGRRKGGDSNPRHDHPLETRRTLELRRRILDGGGSTIALGVKDRPARSGGYQVRARPDGRGVYQVSAVTRKVRTLRRLISPGSHRISNMEEWLDGSTEGATHAHKSKEKT